MTRTLRGLPAWSLTMTAFLSGITAPLGSAAQGQEIPFDEADVFAELNDTDGDLGFHALIDGDAWDRLTRRGPERARDPAGPAGPQPGAAGPDRDLLRERRAGVRRARAGGVLRALPRRRLQISGRTLEGDELEGSGALQPPPAGARRQRRGLRHRRSPEGLRRHRPAARPRAGHDQLGSGHAARIPRSVDPTRRRSGSSTTSWWSSARSRSC